MIHSMVLSDFDENDGIIMNSMKTTENRKNPENWKNHSVSVENLILRFCQK